MIASILDNDLYKFSMGYAYMKLYPQAEGRFEFNDRNHTKFPSYILDQLKNEFNKLAALSLSDEELNWAIKAMPYIPAVYWEWLHGFRFDPSKINARLDEDGHLHIDVSDKLYKVTLYEVPILAIVSETVERVHVLNEADMIARLEKKVALSNEHKLVFSEFGTRRRFSYHVQDVVCKYLKEHATYCVGTSNVHLAMKYDMKPIGTVAHEWVMFHGANFGYRRANYEAYEAWVDVFDGALGVALTDTFTYDAFINNFSLKQAKLFDGVRQDSGNEYEFISKTIEMYKKFGIHPMSKTIVFSNALNFEKYKEISEYCKDKIKCSAGIGTNLTNDTGFKPLNIVMKLNKCRIDSNHKWIDCVKISDDVGKHTGNVTELKIADAELNLGIFNNE